ncbi:hypothetical protein CYY_009985 [Polysphondylium violaceum]|uniref:ABC transporter domain-containing protein n=1 Tax=Polysphondylium violaceum TaxID=133409 RepID=A0A8J4PKK0_9MYCE|nr:hypothetical protein CYY_009985 [Polysphondylium violaceum]
MLFVSKIGKSGNCKQLLRSYVHNVVPSITRQQQQYTTIINKNIGQINNNNNISSSTLLSSTKLTNINDSKFYSSNNNNNKNKKGGPQAPAEKTVISLVDVQKKLDEGRMLLKETSLSFFYGSKIGLLGSNGSGKSSLMRIIAQEDTEHDGEVLYAKDISVGYLHQEPELDEEKDVEGNIFDGIADKKEILDEYEELEQEIEELTGSELKKAQKRLKELKDQIDREKLWDLKRKIAIAIDALNCPPGHQSVVNLSGGERRRVALARLLISAPDILLLDEPTNHLDAESVLWLERFLKDYKGTVIAVTHDRYFLDNVANWILEIDRGTLIPFKGNYSAWLRNKEQRLSLESRKEEGRKKAINRELEYLSGGVKAQTKKNKARIEKYNELVAAAPERYREPGRICIPPCPRLGKDVFDCTNLSIEFDGRKLFENLNIRIEPGSIVGIIGPNGVGKSTLFRIMTGDLKPITGNVRIGETVKLGFVAQSRASLDPDRTIYEEISDGTDVVNMGAYQIHVREYISQFSFKGAEQDKLIGTLSGGERNRVHIAKMIKRGCNVLLLDEPTNDLDVDVLRNLEDALETFPGVAIIISHDRYFLDRLCTHIISFEGEGKVIVHEGNFASYEEERGKKNKRADPTKIKYKKLQTV